MLFLSFFVLLLPHHIIKKMKTNSKKVLAAQLKRFIKTPNGGIFVKQSKRALAFFNGMVTSSLLACPMGGLSNEALKPNLQNYKYLSYKYIKISLLTPLATNVPQLKLTA
jgi:hypothetical protein